MKNKQKKLRLINTHPEEIVEARGIILTFVGTFPLTNNGCVMWVSGASQENIVRWDFSRPTPTASHVWPEAMHR